MYVDRVCQRFDRFCIDFINLFRYLCQLLGQFLGIKGGIINFRLCRSRTFSGIRSGICLGLRLLGQLVKCIRLIDKFGNKFRCVLDVKNILLCKSHLFRQCLCIHVCGLGNFRLQAGNLLTRLYRSRVFNLLAVLTITYIGGVFLFSILKELDHLGKFSLFVFHCACNGIGHNLGYLGGFPG